MKQYAPLDKSKKEKNEINSAKQTEAPETFFSSTDNSKYELSAGVTRNKYCLGETFTAFPPLQAKLRDNTQKDTNKQGDNSPFSAPKNISGGSYSGTQLSVSAMLANQIQDSFGINTRELRLQESADVTKMGARATAQGNTIRFAPGEFQPNTHAGQELLGHELAHIREQAVGNVSASGGNVFMNAEQEACSDAAGVAFASRSLHAASIVNVNAINPYNAPVQCLQKVVYSPQDVDTNKRNLRTLLNNALRGTRGYVELQDTSNDSALWAAVTKFKKILIGRGIYVKADGFMDAITLEALLDYKDDAHENAVSQIHNTSQIFTGPYIPAATTRDEQIRLIYINLATTGDAAERTSLYTFLRTHMTAQDRRNIVFNDNTNPYGGNQNVNRTDRGDMDAINHARTLFRQFPSIQGETDIDRRNRFETYLLGFSEHGCMYVAAANRILVEYANKPDQFLTDYGFPMYNCNNGTIRFMFNKLAIHLYFTTLSRALISNPLAFGSSDMASIITEAGMDSITNIVYDYLPNINTIRRDLNRNPPILVSNPFLLHSFSRDEETLNYLNALAINDPQELTKRGITNRNLQDMNSVGDSDLLNLRRLYMDNIVWGTQAHESIITGEGPNDSLIVSSFGQKLLAYRDEYSNVATLQSKLNTQLRTRHIRRLGGSYTGLNVTNKRIEYKKMSFMRNPPRTTAANSTP